MSELERLRDLVAVGLERERRLEEQLESLLSALREIAYPETRERKDAGIVLARQALARHRQERARKDQARDVSDSRCTCILDGFAGAEVDSECAEHFPATDPELRRNEESTSDPASEPREDE